MSGVSAKDDQSVERYFPLVDNEAAMKPMVIKLMFMNMMP
jgi:hypothetical protein